MENLNNSKMEITEIKTSSKKTNKVKNWLNDDVIKLTAKEKKALRNKAYYEKTKKSKSFIPKSDFKLKYNNGLYDMVNSRIYTHKGCLTYNTDRSMHGAFKDAYYLFNNLYSTNKIDTCFFKVEYKPKHVHVHYLINTPLSDSQISKRITNLFRNNFQSGYNFQERIKTTDAQVNAIKYLVYDLAADSKYHYKQQEIDYWHIVPDMKLNTVPAISNLQVIV